MNNNDSQWNLAKFHVYYGTLLRFWYISLTCSFTFGPFKNIPKNFGFFWNGSKFQNFGLGNGKS